MLLRVVNIAWPLEDELRALGPLRVPGNGTGTEPLREAFEERLAAALARAVRASIAAPQNTRWRRFTEDADQASAAQRAPRLASSMASRGCWHRGMSCRREESLLMSQGIDAAPDDPSAVG